MKIRILQCEKGAVQAEGLTVVIDVFRAFTLEAYLLSAGAEKVIVAGTVEEALAWKKEHPEVILAGERNGRKCEGFDIGNSPAAAAKLDVKGKTIVHTTSNGTRGIMKAAGAQEILTGALVNAKATAEYIRMRNPGAVSLVCMGWGDEETAEDTLCAEYIASLLRGEVLADYEKRLADLRYTSGAKFFDPMQQEAYPKEDYPYCIKTDLFSFAVGCTKEGNVMINRRI